MLNLKKDKESIILCNTMVKKIVAIHQPNLFPWLGYFNKIYRSDEFVFLDHTINNRTEAIYTRRVQVLNTQGVSTFLTIPVRKITGSDFGPLNQWEINFEQIGFPRKQLESFKQTYSKHFYFDEVFPFIELFFEENYKNSLTLKNINFIKEICQKLNINTNFHISSDFNIDLNSTEMLISIVKLLEGNSYLSGAGGDNYQDPNLFKAKNIDLIRQKYMHPTYLQNKSNNFINGLSIIDCLMNIGFNKTEILIKN